MCVLFELIFHHAFAVELQRFLFVDCYDEGGMFVCILYLLGTLKVCADSRHRYAGFL